VAYRVTLKDVIRVSQEREDRVIVFPTGGHMGNLYRPDVREAIREGLGDVLPRDAEARLPGTAWVVRCRGGCLPAGRQPTGARAPFRC
jgi:hypothetical protein